MASKMTTACHKPHTTTAIRTSNNLRRVIMRPLHSLTSRIRLLSLPTRHHRIRIPPIRLRILNRPIKLKALSQTIRCKTLSRTMGQKIPSRIMQHRKKIFLLTITMAVVVKKQPPLLLPISKRITLVWPISMVPPKKQHQRQHSNTSSRTTLVWQISMVPPKKQRKRQHSNTKTRATSA